MVKPEKIVAKGTNAVGKFGRMPDSYSVTMKPNKPIPKIDRANRGGDNNVTTRYLNNIIW